MAAFFRSRSRALALGLAVALGWVLWSAWVHRGHWVDDAFISLRYASHWLSGEGLVFHPGERVEGVTNLGWVWVVGAVGAALPVPLPALAKVLGLLFSGAAVVVTTLSYRRLVPDASGVELALLPVLVASSPELVYFSLAGMETGLAALLLVIGLRVLVSDRLRLPISLLLAGLTGGLLFSVRPEAVLLVPLFALLLVAFPGDSGRPGRPEPLRRRTALVALLALGAFLAVVLAVTAFRLGYYGAPLPNTFVAKSPGPPEAVAGRAWEAFVGRHANLPAPWVGSALLLFGGAGLWTLLERPERRPGALFLAAGVLTGAAFAVYAPADWTDTGRYFAPYVPFAAALGLRGLFALAERLARRLPDGAFSGRTAAGTAALVALLFVAAGLWRGQLHFGRIALGAYPGFVLASETLIGPSRWIDEHLPPGTVIAARRIGALGYFGDRPVLDYAFGLTDPEVARRRRGVGPEPFASPDAPELAPLWERRPPDCLLEDGDVLAPLRDSGDSDRLTVHGVTYRQVERFALGDGAAEWVLACRAFGRTSRSLSPAAARSAARESTPAAAR